MTPILRLVVLALLVSAPALWLPVPVVAKDFERTTGGGGGSFNRFPSREPEPADPAELDAAGPGTAGSEAATLEAAGETGTPPAAPAPETVEGEEPDAAADDEEQDPVPERTHGKACIYGARGQVLYQPEGKGCGAEAAVPAAAAADDDERSPVSSPSSPSHCMYNNEGRVLYKAPGATCEPRRQFAPSAE